MTEFQFIGEMESCVSALSLLYELTYEEEDPGIKYDLSVAENALIERMENTIKEQYKKVFANYKKETQAAS